MMIGLSGCSAPTSPTSSGTYTVTYSGNGNTSGSVPISQTASQGSAILVQANSGSLVKTGYKFSGWNTAADGTGRAYAANVSTVFSGDTTLYVSWAASYTVTYNGNGNTGGAVPTDANSYISGASVILAGNSQSLTKTGTTFAGWNTKADGTGTAYAANASLTMGSANIILYASWTSLPTYTLTYNGSSNTGGFVPTDSNNYLSGATAVVLGNTGSLVKSGYAFSKWSTSPNGTGTLYSVGSTLTMGSTNVTLYAVWSPAYSVTYDGNGSTGGTVPVDSTPYASGTSVIIASNSGSLTKTNVTFYGWNTAADGTGTAYAAGSSMSMPSANRTLYAIWSFTVTYDGNGNDGGTVPSPETYLTGASPTAASKPAALSLTGYQFAGWNTLASGLGTQYQASAFGCKLPSSSNLRLYARWISTAYIIGSGSFLNSSSVSIQDFVVFSGWVAAPTGSVAIPDGIYEYGQNTSSQTSASLAGVTEVVIPSSMAMIDGYVFASGLGYTSSLTNVKLLSSTPPSIFNSSQLFSGISPTISVPNSALATYKAAAGWSPFSSKMVGY